MRQLELYINYYNFVASDAFRYVTPYFKKRIIYYNPRGQTYYR